MFLTSLFDLMFKEKCFESPTNFGRPISLWRIFFDVHIIFESVLFRPFHTISDPLPSDFGSFRSAFRFFVFGLFPKFGLLSEIENILDFYWDFFRLVSDVCFCCCLCRCRHGCRRQHFCRYERLFCRSRRRQWRDWWKFGEWLFFILCFVCIILHFVQTWWFMLQLFYQERA